MNATLLIPPTATYEEWKARRAELSRTAVTASEIAIILGISPWSSPFNLYHLKRGTITDDFEDDAMSLGRHLEPWIADRWAEDHLDWFVGLGGLWVSGERPWQMCTPDRLLYRGVPVCPPGDLIAPDPDESLLEIKSWGTYDGWGEDGTDQIPAHIRAQVLWQMDTLGLEAGHVTCWFKHTDRRRDYLIGYDEGDVKLMREAAQEFLAQVTDGQSPPIDHTPATTRTLKQLHPDLEDAEAEVPLDLAEDYRFAKLSLDDARDNYDLLANQVRAAMGDAKRAVFGERKVATRSVFEQARVDLKRLKNDFPDAYAACRTTTTVDKLTPARAKKEAS